ncbi:hypothetical protein [Desulfosporosinus sp.]|nr:hypothetical protein [Desulfosporosinus sp.]MBC2727059.1 hypothetical protein [Desulfosporosinus sp.]
MYTRNQIMYAVDHFKQSLQEGSQPTALALSVLDIKEPAYCEGSKCSI